MHTPGFPRVGDDRAAGRFRKSEPAGKVVPLKRGRGIPDDGHNGPVNGGSIPLPRRDGNAISLHGQGRDRCPVSMAVILLTGPSYPGPGRP